MPIKPNKDEKRKDFISRCISTEVKAGKDQKQASGICFTAWREAKGMPEPENKLDIFGEMGWNVFGEEFKNEIENSSGDIEIRVNSRGGSIFEALTIYNAIQNYNKGKVTAIIEGAALSSASWAIQAADVVKMTNMSLWNMHDPVVNISGSLDQVSSQLQALEKTKDLIVNAYSKRALNLSKDRIVQLMKNSTWMSAEEALENGFIDEVMNTDKKIEVDISNEMKDEVPSKYQSFLKERESTVSEILNLAKELGLDVQESTSEGDIKNMVLESLKKKPEQKKPKMQLPKAIINQLIENRQSKILNLQEKGKITKAVGDDLVKEYCNETHIVNHLSEDGDIDDSFDNVTKALAKNDSVVEMGEITNMQNPLKDDENPMIASAKRMRKAAGLTD